MAGHRLAFITATVLILSNGASFRAGTPDDASNVRMIAAEGVAAKYWPRWRGPSGQGIVAPGAYVDRWSDGEKSDNILWRVSVGGRGNSSPIVWDDRIFFTTAYDGGQ